MMRRMRCDRVNSRWIALGAIALAVAAAIAACSYDGELDALSCDDDGDCASEAACIDGYCVLDHEGDPLCSEGEQECGERCVDTDTDLENCGGCGISCSTDVDDALPVCEGGSCGFQCQAGYDECDGMCVDTDESLAHCGGCAQRCETDDPHGAPLCEAGQCRVTCLGDFDHCGGECVDTDQSAQHCGSCGNDCGVTAQCIGGTCEELDCAPEAEPFGGGEGTEQDPYTLCATKHVQNIHGSGSASGPYLDAHFLLYDDIDFQGLSMAPIGRGGSTNSGEMEFEESFEGVFDGNGNALYNISINLDTTGVGVFGAILEDAVVRDLELIDVQISGNRWVGGLAAVNHGLIEEVSVTGSVDARQEVGGLVGLNTGDVIRSSADVGVTAEERRGGGLVGLQMTGTIDEANAFGDVSGAEGLHTIGGLVGYNSDSSSEIRNSQAFGDVSGGDDVGGLIGRARGELSDLGAHGEVSGAEGVGGLVGHLEGPLHNGVYEGESVSGVESVGGLVGGASADISIHDSEVQSDVTVQGTTAVGGLLGRGFAEIHGSQSHASVSGNKYLGGLVGLVDDDGDGDRGAVSNSHATGAVVASGEDSEFVGGLVGELRGDISTSFATGEIDASESLRVGGLVGEIHRFGGIEDSYATGDVEGESRVGGFVGEVSSSGGSGEGEIHTSFSTGMASGDAHVGGFVGRNQGLVEDSYWNMDTSQTTESDGGMGLTANEFSEDANFDGFDFGDIWEMGSERPRLQWE